MSGALAEVQEILILYGETDVAFFDDADECPECGELLDEDGFCPNGCLDDDDFYEDEEEYYAGDEMDDVRCGVDYYDDEEEENGYF